MPNWRKVIVSGSNAVLNSLIVSNGATVTGSVSVTGSNIVLAQGSNLITHHVQAAASNGAEILTNTGGVVALFGAGGSLGTTFYGQVNGTTFSGSLLGTASTASYVLQAVSASYATTALSASYAPVTPTFPYTGSAIISGSLKITGSLRGQVSALTISSNTASVDLSINNFFTLTLANGTGTNINPTNINPGQTVNILVTQGLAGTGTVTFPSSVKQPSGSFYTGSAVANAVDIVTMIAFDSTNVYVSSVRNMI